MLFEKIQLESDENIIIIVRKHWFVLFKNSIGVILLIVLPFVIWVLLKNVSIVENEFVLIVSQYIPVLLFLYALWTLINWMILAYIWTDYYLDVWTVTDRRVIKIDQLGFFNRQIGSFRLEKLQDMDIKIKGIIATFLDFGSVAAQTASGSHQEEFKSTYLPKPRELKSIMLKAADKRMRKKHTNHTDI